MFEEDKKLYWQEEFKEICDGVTFKFRKMNTVEHLNMVTKNVEFENMDGDKAEYFIQKCLSLAIWSKDGVNWTPVVDADGNAKLPELDTNPSIALDLFYYFKREVLLPVFTGSKTFQNSMKAVKEDLEKKN